jgi:HSP20 family protein
MLSKPAKIKSMTSLVPNVINPLENREMLKDWRLNIEFPPVNVIKAEEWHQVSMAIPGMKMEDFNIDIEDNKLIISVEKKEEVEETKEDYVHQEYNYRKFKRTFSLPDNIMLKDLEKSYNNGILTIRLPKVREDKTVKK